MASHPTQLLETPATHSKSLFRYFDVSWNYFTERLVTWTPLTSMARNNILSLLSKIKIGEVTIISPERTWHFGSPSTAHPDLNVILKVRSDAFWTRIAIFTDIGLAEAFIYGDVDCDDITAMLKILILNRKLLGVVNSMADSIAAVCRAIVVKSFRGDLRNSRANISSHYDLGNTMFTAFLSKDMCYSSAIFKDYEEDIRPGSASNLESLEDAQLRKMRAILKKVRIQPGDRILEIGTGFGSLSILAAQTVPDCTIDTITLSIHQTTLARKRIAEAGLSDRITVYNVDFRECFQKTEWKGAFDRFISIEMIENVGKDFIPEYWRVVDWALKEDTAIGMVQVISMPESRVPSYDRHVDFVQKWASTAIPEADEFTLTIHDQPFFSNRSFQEGIFPAWHSL